MTAPKKHELVYQVARLRELGELVKILMPAF
jgi:hypothetical protein